MSLTVRKIGFMVTVQLDEDGTPLTPIGDRMVEVRPGEWMDPLAAALISEISVDFPAEL
jgi:hypothetical protein